MVSIQPDMERDALTFFFVAGEASGDLHGSRLIREIRRLYPASRFVGHGGDRMKAEGMEIVEHINNLAIMGFTEVIKQLPYMLRVMKITIEKLKQYRPDRLILIDYPGFNLRLARKAGDLGIPVTYFILPQVWAWKEKRISVLREYVDQALCIFPFEQVWFKERGVPAEFVGHPFAEQTVSGNVGPFYEKHDLNRQSPILVLLPGSRQQEIDRHWTIFLETVDQLKRQIPDLQVVVGRAPDVTLEPVPEYVKVEEREIQAAMTAGTAALVASGTATLEAAVFDLPMVVCYRLSAPTWWLARRMAKVSYASMVNLIADRRVVPEYLQSDMTPANLAGAVLPLLTDTAERKKMLSGFEEIRRTLGLPGVYERAATAILGATRR
ncbi:MAG: lipid-A-disaccharide synthase [FCB group bacterium]|nr:lipid-A-disaccharide synthase [FCB group bacterium]